MKKLFLVSIVCAAFASTAIAQIRVGGQNVDGAGENSNEAPPLEHRVKSVPAAAEANIMIPAGKEDKYSVTLHVYRSFVRANTAPYGVASTNQAMNLFMTGIPSNRVDFNITPAMVTQPTATPTNETLWVSIEVATKDGSMFLPSVVTMETRSTDTNAYLQSVSDLGRANLTFSPTTIGVINTNGGGMGILNSPAGGKLSEVPVHRLCFAGIQVPYFTYTNQAEFDAIAEFILNHPNWQVKTTAKVTENGVVVARATRTVGTTGIPFQPGLVPGRTNGAAIFSVVADVANTAALYRSPVVTGPYTFHGTVNHGDYFVRTNAMGFFLIKRY
jgi:hypothetical protein